MSTVPSSRQNPDEFHGLHEQPATNVERGHRAAEAGQPAPSGAPHQDAPNYGEFGQPEARAAAPEAPDTQAAPLDDTHHGDDRFRHSGTRNWATDEPANPHQYKEGEWADM